MRLKDNKNGYWGYMNEEVRHALAAVADSITVEPDTNPQIIMSNDLGVAVNQLEVGLVGATFLGPAGFTQAIAFTNIPTYADDAAAGSGGLLAGYIYKTAGGDLKIKL